MLSRPDNVVGVDMVGINDEVAVMAFDIASWLTLRSYNSREYIAVSPTAVLANKTDEVPMERSGGGEMPDKGIANSGV